MPAVPPSNISISDVVEIALGFLTLIFSTLAWLARRSQRVESLETTKRILQMCLDDLRGYEATLQSVATGFGQRRLDAAVMERLFAFRVGVAVDAIPQDRLASLKSQTVTGVQNRVAELPELLRLCFIGIPKSYRDEQERLRNLNNNLHMPSAQQEADWLVARFERSLSTYRDAIQLTNCAIAELKKMQRWPW